MVLGSFWYRIGFEQVTRLALFQFTEQFPGSQEDGVNPCSGGLGWGGGLKNKLGSVAQIALAVGQKWVLKMEP